MKSNLGRPVNQIDAYQGKINWDQHSLEGYHAEIENLCAALRRRDEN